MCLHLLLTALHPRRLSCCTGSLWFSVYHMSNVQIRWKTQLLDWADIWVLFTNRLGMSAAQNFFQNNNFLAYDGKNEISIYLHNLEDISNYFKIQLIGMGPGQGRGLMDTRKQIFLSMSSKKSTKIVKVYKVKKTKVQFSS